MLVTTEQEIDVRIEVTEAYMIRGGRGCHSGEHWGQTAIQCVKLIIVTMGHCSLTTSWCAGRGGLRSLPSAVGSKYWRAGGPLVLLAVGEGGGSDCLDGGFDG